MTERTVHFPLTTLNILYRKRSRTHTTVDLDRILKQSCIQKGVEHTIGSQVHRHTQNGMNKSDSSMPFFFRHRAKHIIRINKVEEYKDA